MTDDVLILTDPGSPFWPRQEGNDFLPLTAPLPGETVTDTGAAELTRSGQLASPQ